MTRCSVEARASWPRELPCRHRRHRRRRRRRVHSDLSVAMCGSTLICIFGYRMAAKERKRAAVQRLWWQRLRRQRLCIAKLAQAPQALVIVGACTARGQAQAPRARQLMGVQASPLYLEDGAGTAVIGGHRCVPRAWPGVGTASASNHRVQAASVHFENGAGAAGMGVHRCMRRAWLGAGAAGTSNEKAQASPVHFEVGAGTAGIGFRRRGRRAWAGGGIAGTSHNWAQASLMRFETGAGAAGIGLRRRMLRARPGTGTAGTSKHMAQAACVHLEHWFPFVGAGPARGQAQAPRACQKVMWRR